MASNSTGRIALLSIHPRFADLIMKGKKRVEFRKSKFRQEISHVVVYATSPVKRILGYFEVSHIFEGSPQELWDRYGEIGGASRSEFHDYFDSAERGVAIGIAKLRVMRKPMPISALGNSASPPQSFMYLSDKTFKVIQRYT